MTKKGLLDRLRSWNRPLVLDEPSDGPLAFGVRRDGKGSVRPRRRRDDDDRLALAAQTGIVAVLAPIFPRGAAATQFSIAEAETFADELGTTIFHLLAEGAQIEGLSRTDLERFVRDRITRLEPRRSKAPAAQTQPARHRVAARAPPEHASADAAIFQQLAEIENAQKGEESPFFEI